MHQILQMSILCVVIIQVLKTIYSYLLFVKTQCILNYQIHISLFKNILKMGLRIKNRRSKKI